MEKLKDYPYRIGWLTIFELWNNHSWVDAHNPFRIWRNQSDRRNHPGS